MLTARIDAILLEKGIPKAQFYRDCGITSAAYSQWRTGKTEPRRYRVKQIAEYLGVSVRYLEADQSEVKQIALEDALEKAGLSIASITSVDSHDHIVTKPTGQHPAITDDFITFPVVGDLAAGYDHVAYEDWEGDTIDIPCGWLHGRKPDEFFVLRVKGDSMYPLYQDGDLVLVLSQSTMNRSGEIGVVIYDDENATLKRVEYVMGEDWMKLSPVNPQYPPVTITDERLEHCRVLGVPKYLVREIKD